MLTAATECSANVVCIVSVF